MSLVQAPPKPPSRRRGGKGRSPRHLKRRAPLPPGKGAEKREEELNKAVLGGRDEECWYQNYQRPPLRSTQMKERIQQFSCAEKVDRVKMERKEGLKKTQLPKLSYTTSTQPAIEPKVWTPQIEVLA